MRFQNSYVRFENDGRKIQRSDRYLGHRKHGDYVLESEILVMILEKRVFALGLVIAVELGVVFSMERELEEFGQRVGPSVWRHRNFFCRL